MLKSTISAKDLNKRLTARVLELCRHLYPNGRIDGSEYVLGDLNGNQGKSLKINISEGEKSGVWADFATSESGDLLDLIQLSQNCSFLEAVKFAKRFLGITDNPPLSSTSKKEYKTPNLPAQITEPSQAMYDWFQSVRGISKATVDAYGVKEAITRDGRMAIVFPYYEDNAGKILSHIKYRNLKDKKDMWTSKDSKKILFGWQAVNPQSRELVITEGEIDAMAYYEQGIPAVSVPCGGGGKGKQDWITDEWEKLSAYEKIYLSLDMDQTGQEGANEIADRIGRHKCYFVDLTPYKDADDAIRESDSLKVRIWDAQTRDPNELHDANSYWDKAIEYANNKNRCKGDSLPWKATESKVGLRLGELIIWAGYNGHGKSQILGHIMTHSISFSQKWCVASMEFRPEKFLNRLYRQITGEATWQSHEKGIKEFLADKLYFVDIQGTIDIDVMLETFKYAKNRFGVDHFLIDSLAKCGLADDDYAGQKKLADRFSDFARDFDVQVNLVCHAKKTKSERDLPDKFDIKGSGGIIDMADSAFIVFRNKDKEEKIADGKNAEKYFDKFDCLLICCKQREGEWEGRTSLFFDRESLQYGETPNFTPLPYCKSEEEFVVEEQRESTEFDGSDIPF